MLVAEQSLSYICNKNSNIIIKVFLNRHGADTKQFKRHGNTIEGKYISKVTTHTYVIYK